MIISDLSYLEDVSQELSNKAANTIPRGGSAVVYLDDNYQGWLGSFNSGSSAFSSKANDKVSSITVTPGEKWLLCEDINYGGDCQEITQSFNKIEGSGFPEDKLSSLRKV